MRGKISPAIKQKAVAEIESGRLSQNEAARRLNVNGETILNNPVSVSLLSGNRKPQIRF